MTSRERDLSNRIWTTNDGRCIHLKKMEQNHLENLLVWIDKRLSTMDSKYLGRWAKVINEELECDHSRVRRASHRPSRLRRDI